MSRVELLTDAVCAPMAAIAGHAHAGPLRQPAREGAPSPPGGRPLLPHRRAHLPGNHGNIPIAVGHQSQKGRENIPIAGTNRLACGRVIT
eukprot:8756279-Pyramimonas_sp.AAC.1